MTRRYSLRGATDADLEPMMRIGHEGLRPHIEALRGWDQAEHEAGFREHFVPEQISIVEVGGVAVGYFKMLEEEDHCFLEGIYLGAEVRGQGLGTRILEDLLDCCGQAGKPMRLQVFQTNPAQHLYRRLGFAVTRETDTHLFMERHPNTG